MSARLEDMASERLTRAAYEGLYEALNLKRLIAFVGSGVSLVYGNLTWEQFRDEVIHQTRDQLNAAKEEVADSRLRRDLQRALDALEELRNSDMDQATMVFDLCERAINEVEGNGDRARSGFRSELKKYFLSDRHFATKTLMARVADLMAASPYARPASPTRHRRVARLKQWIASLDASHFYSGLARFYSKDTIMAVAEASGAPELEPLVEALSKDLARHCTGKGALPADRRSLLAVLLAFAAVPPAASRVRRTVLKCFAAALRPDNSAHDSEDRPNPRPLLDPLKTLRDINVRRFLTTNYDLELENLFMFNDVRGRRRLPVEIDEELDRLPGFSRSDEGRSWARRLTNGLVVRSDVYDGFSTSRLFEFGIGSVDNDVHIYHLHGRADLPETMVATDSDYNRTYREERISRPSFDRAYDVTISGNPILFIGSGMSEAELTRTLRHRVSNPRLHRDSPVYVLRGVTDTPGKLILDQLDLYNRLGVHVIHYGHPRRGEQWSLRKALLLIDGIALAYAIRAGWTNGTRDRSDDERVRIAKMIQDGLVRLEDYSLIHEELPFDREIVRWLVGKEAKALWETADCSSSEDKVRCGLLADYLSKLVDKLHTAALIHELREIGREAGDFYRRKATRIRPRRVWAYGQQREGQRPVRARRKFGARHVEAFTASADDRDSEGKWWIRNPDGSRQPLSGPEDLLPADAGRTALPRLFGGGRQVTVALGDRGSRKGSLLRMLAERLIDRPETLIVNCSFGLEADSIVSMVEKFIVDEDLPDGTQANAVQDKSFESRRQKMRVKLAELPWSRHPLLILGAVDRLFGLDGKPLSAEFEWMLRLLLDSTPRLNLLVLGSRRCERWFEVELAGAAEKGHRLIRLEWTPTTEISDIDRLVAAVRWPEAHPPWPDRAKARLQTSGVARRPVLVASLALDALRDGDGPASAEERARDAAIGRVAQEILKTLAFIGLPCEGELLMIAPDVADLLRAAAGHDRHAQNETFIAALDRALSRKLVLLVEPSGSCPVEPYRPPTAPGGPAVEVWPNVSSPARYAIGTRQRFVLHRIVFQEFRSRYGLPLGETVLNNSYNLSLYAAQPDDLPTVEAEAAADLERLAEGLKDGWRQVDLAANAADAGPVLGELDRLTESCLGSHYSEDARNPDRLSVLQDFDRFLRLHASLAVASIRAAGGVVRGILSASNILGLDIDSARKPGPAVIHQQKTRIRQLLDMAIDLQAARDLRTAAQLVDNRELGLRADLRGLWKLALDRRVGSRPLETAEAAGAALFDDPRRDMAERWLMEAQALEDDASLPLSRQLVRPLWARLAGTDDPAAHPSNNLDRWPFYEEEIVWLLNERAMLSLAQGDLYSAETTFGLAFAANAGLEGERYHPNRCRLLINRALLWIERGKINEARRCLVELRNGLLHEPEAVATESDEGRLILAVAKGFESLCDDLQGLTDRADQGYCSALTELYALRQQRAVAIFEYHRASLLQLQPGRRDEAARCFTQALAAAQAGRHTDVIYRIRIGKAGADRHRDVISPGQALAIYGAARQYGEQFDMHRVTVQALGASTRLRLEAGEVETAAQDCSRALALATRNGMALWRISLRILTGLTLQKRGDSANARFMMERAVAEAERIGYQRAVDQASSELMRSVQQSASPS